MKWNRIRAVAKKELKKFFTNFRMLGAIFLPGILIFALYSILGNVMNSVDITNLSRDYEYSVVMSDNYNLDNEENNKPLIETTLSTYLKLDNYKEPTFTYINKNEIEAYKDKLLSNEIDLLIEFSDDFENQILNLESKANINIWYNQENGYSESLYSISISLIQSTYQSFTINLTNPNPAVGESSYSLNQVISFILPLITISLLYSTTLSSCTESIAGEKDRGTIASILVSPIKRSEFAIGKVIALSIVSIVSGAVSGIGVVASLPSMLGDISISAISLMMLFLMILSAVIFFVAFTSMVSAFAKSVKEALSYLGPFSGIFIVVALIPSLTNTNNVIYSFVPVLNICSSMNMALIGNIDILFFIITIISNVIYTALFILLIVKMFNNENIMFRR